MDQIIYLDANIFLEVLLCQEKVGESESLLRKIASNSIRAVISNFSIHSIALMLDRCKKSPEDIKIFLISLRSYTGLSIYSPSIADTVIASGYMKKFGLDFEDSLVLQCCLATGCKTIVSFDKDFDGISVIKRMTPSQIN
ncbi:MAG: type II toxin-antitoxin system VapC family toxin [Candidatus Woesearchaeota archaeon]|nr:type II toxin-antitoxin system VapC family toxin [Candidatus Woesearchaeota archaeon]